MSFIAGLNPWVAMWSQPRSTIRAIAHSRPTYGVYYLATVYALQSFFFYANWWSLGLNARYPLMISLGVVLSPFVGIVWLYFMGFIYYVTGRILKGEAPAVRLRASVAWSAIPYSITLLMWLILIFMNPAHVFIQDSGAPSSLFVNLISMIVGIWSLVLLVQSVREVQQFTAGRAITNVFLAWIFSWIIGLVLFSVMRYFYLHLITST